MNIEAVTVCVDYSDFLAHTLPLNKPHVNRLVVVTAPHDRATQRLAAHHNVHCVVTEAFYRGGDRFNKGRGINAGLMALGKRDWLLHLDADIVLPPQTRQFLERAQLDPAAIYGIDRTMCADFNAWTRYQRAPIPHYENEVFLNWAPFPTGTRIAKLDAGGYVPIGFFQLWHSNSGRLKYPEHHSTAARSDMLFALQWPRSQRLLLPEIMGIHLASDAGRGMGANWNGRQTPEFGPESQDAQRLRYE
jgi:hypothetical protein